MTSVASKIESRVLERSMFEIRTDCPCCNSRKGAVVYESSYVESPIKDYLLDFYRVNGGPDFSLLLTGRYVLIECLSCGLIYQEQIPNDELMQTIYEGWIDPTLAFENRKSKPLSSYLDLFKQLANISTCFDRPLSAMKVLDFGMGWGEWCKAAMAFGCEAFGMELSPARISHARSVGIKVLDWEALGQHEFDVINAEQVFEHISRPSETLEYLARSLRKNGVMRISVPDGWDIKRRLRTDNWFAPKGTRDSLNPVAPLEHINCFRHHVLLGMGQRAGLHPVVIPNKYVTSTRDLVRSNIKPIYWFLRGAKNTTICFQKK